MSIMLGEETGRLKWVPEPYMMKAVRWLLSHAGAGLFLDPGLRKTSITLAALSVLKKNGELRKGALVVAPLRPLYNVWDSDNPDSEPRKWQEFEHFKIVMLHGNDKDEMLKQKADIYLINPDGLDWLISKIGPSRFDVLVVDESTMFKHANTQRFKILRAYLSNFARRWILTGTPSPNGLMDLFGQIYILDFGNALGRYITHYRRNFFDAVGFGGYTYVPQKDAEQRIYKRIEPLVMRMDEKDYLKLPRLIGALAYPKTRPSLIEIELLGKARKVYDQVEELFFAELEDGSVTAANAGVKSIKLRQVANGGIYLDKGGEDADAKGPRKWSLVHEQKSDAVVELMDDLDGRQSVIAIEFRHDIARLRQHKRLKNVLAIGEKKGAAGVKEDVLIASDFNRGKISELLVNPATFSRGSNMQGRGKAGADALIFHSNTFNFEHYDQLVRRFWRSGRVRPFYVHHVVAKNTVDQAMIYAINRKNKTQRGLLDALRAYSFRRPRRGVGKAS